MSTKTTPRLYTPLCDLLGCDLPILLAGMGGVARWELAASVANAGGFAALGMVRESPELIAAEVTALQAATDRRFAVNLIPAATDPALLDAQITQCLKLGVTAFSFFWDVRAEVIARVKSEGALVLHQVGTLQQARLAEQAGADVIIAQGIEAGGHVHGRCGSFALVEAILQETALPVVVSGGISTGKGLASALMLGAQGVQCGTAFLATEESFAHSYHKQRVVEADGEDTVLTDVFVLNWPKGAAVRVIGNTITEALDGQLMGHDPDTLPRDTIAWEDGQERYRYSTDSPLRTTTGDLEAMPNYAGQGAGLIRSILPAGQRVEQMAQEAATCFEGATPAHRRQP
ncbi:NAD(P)H-dependent flavin oxidoreductase [Roseovarius sp. S1116L3]|uniref:NAD(P)H-dependent flavin oxidoreductase n=1 Tax=Roseovarius roseus TaxID=3342636 RepID=UPI003726674D